MPPLYNAYEAKLFNVLHSKLCKENLFSYLPNWLRLDGHVKEMTTTSVQALRMPRLTMAI
jgi:hypothetical protein